MTISYHIQYILKEKKIIDFLKARNIHPARQQGDRFIYHCPLHERDNDPSFTVYTGAKYQNYFCFGCSVGGNIINLLSALDNISLRQSVKQLIKDVNIDEIEVLKSLTRALQEGEIVDNDKSIEKLTLKLNIACYEHFKETNFDRRELSFFEKLFPKIDKIMMIRDGDALEKIYNFLISRGLIERKNNYQEKQEKILIKENGKY